MSDRDRCPVCAIKKQGESVRPEMKDAVLVACVVAGLTIKNVLDYMCLLHRALTKDAIGHVLG